MRGSGPDMGYPCDVVRAPRRVLGRAVLSEMDGVPMHGAVESALMPGRECVGDPVDADLLVVAPSRDLGVVELSDAEGRRRRVAECFERPSGAGDGVVERHEHGRESRVRVVGLHDERDQRVKDVVAAASVECVRLIGGRDAQYEQSVVLTRPLFAEVLELRSDAFSPVLGERRDPLDHYAVSFDDLRAVVAGAEPVALGVLLVWHDERSSYQVVAGPRPYKRRPEQVVGVGFGVFDALVPAMLDLFGEQAPDHLCLHIVARDDNPDGRVRYVPLGPSAQEVLDSFERHIADSTGGKEVC